MTPITTLAPHQVFVYGSNSTGFSGAGAAGLAVRGTSANTWRTDEWFLRAMRAPVGSPDRIGKWAVFGVARGWSQGREGMGYAIETIRHPGHKRSTPLREIEDQLVDLFLFADKHPEWEFLMTPVGAGLAGWTPEEMAHTLARAVDRHDCISRAGYARPNVVIPPDLYEGINWRET